MFVGLLNPDKKGKLLLRRRTELESIIPGKSFKRCWELPGGAVEHTEEKINYSYPIEEAVRELKEEVGIVIQAPLMGIVHLTFFKGPKGYDLAGVVPVIATEEPTKGETIYVSPKELNELAKKFVSSDKKTGKDGEGLLSGWAKRMHCMALYALMHSPNEIFVEQAKTTIVTIQAGW